MCIVHGKSEALVIKEILFAGLSGREKKVSVNVVDEATAPKSPKAIAKTKLQSS